MTAQNKIRRISESSVTDQWLSSGTSSWQQLIDAMRGAEMDQATTDEIATNVL